MKLTSFLFHSQLQQQVNMLLVDIITKTLMCSVLICDGVCVCFIIRVSSVVCDCV